MFFSTEVTREANACDLGHYISLSDSADVWADEILKACRENMPCRRSRAQDVAAAGFDSASEAARMQRYYLNAAERLK